MKVTPVTFAIGWIIALALLCGQLAGCKSAIKPETPIGASAGEGGAAAKALTESAERNNQRLKPFVKTPGKPLSEAITDDHAGILKALMESQIQVGILQTNAASLYGHTIEANEQKKAAEKAGAVALDNERSLFLSYRQRVAIGRFWKGVSLAVLGLVVWQLVGWAKGFATPWGLVVKLLGR
jgi:hypothetical protein